MHQRHAQRVCRSAEILSDDWLRKSRQVNLIGLCGGDVVYLGPLNLLTSRSTNTLPEVFLREPAPEISGKKSNKFRANLKVFLLSDILGAMGGNIAVHIGYTDARYLQLQYVDVTTSFTKPLAVGKYLKGAEVDLSHSVAKQFVVGDSRLFLITKTVQSKRLLVRYERERNQPASVNLKALFDLVGGSLKVEAADSQGGTISFASAHDLVFGFQCWELGIGDGALELISVAAGSMFPGDEAAVPMILTPDGLLRSTFHAPLLNET